MRISLRTHTLKAFAQAACAGLPPFMMLGSTPNIMDPFPPPLGVKCSL